MRRRIVWPRPAEQDLENLVDFIGKANPAAALRFLDAAKEAAAKLADSPELAGNWKSPNPSLAGIRIWPIPRFEK